MPVDDCGALRDDQTAIDRDEHEISGLGEVGSQPLRIDRLVEDIDRHAVEDGFLAGLYLPDFDWHGWSPDKAFLEPPSWVRGSSPGLTDLVSSSCRLAPHYEGLR